MNYLVDVGPIMEVLGTTPRETAQIRTLARLGDIYIMNNTFMLSRLTGALGRQTPAAARERLRSPSSHGAHGPLGLRARRS